jgi:predicted DNA-binding transcriptional regulator AlpA
MLGACASGLIGTSTPALRRGPVTEWVFRLDLNVRELSDHQLDALYEAGCDDATFATDASGAYAMFDRADATPEAAVLSAIRDIEGAGAQVRVIRVATEDDWLTVPEIAQRTGRSRQSVHQLVNGERGPGEFPAPVSRRDRRSPLWRWEEVRTWFARHEPGSLPAEPPRPSADFLAVVNDRLDLRERLRRLPDEPWWSDVDVTLPLVG